MRSSRAIFSNAACAPVSAAVLSPAYSVMWNSVPMCGSVYSKRESESGAGAVRQPPANNRAATRGIKKVGNDFNFTAALVKHPPGVAGRVFRSFDFPNASHDLV